MVGQNLEKIQRNTKASITNLTEWFCTLPKVVYETQTEQSTPQKDFISYPNGLLNTRVIQRIMSNFQKLIK